MDSLNLNKHISGQFNAELESIRTQVMTMGGMVEQQLSDAITAMHNQDSDLAKRVIEGDKNVNMMEVAIDEACVRIIARSLSWLCIAVIASESCCSTMPPMVITCVRILSSSALNWPEICLLRLRLSITHS